MLAHSTELNIANIIKKELGLTFKGQKIEEYSKRILDAAVTLGYNDLSSFLSKVITNESKFTREEKRVLAAHLTVSETYFFREKPAISMLIKTIIPQLIKKKEKIRIWSAGCSSGEEPYTIAIILQEHFPQLSLKDFQILATDINPTVLEKAEKGLYTPWSFREIPEMYVKKYFTKKGTLFQISDKIKECVKFDYLNLAADIFPGEAPGSPHIDIILCRNVLMYLNQDLIKQISKRFKNILKSEGWFIPSQVELNDDFFGGFTKVYGEDGVFYRNGGETQRIQINPSVSRKTKIKPEKLEYKEYEEYTEERVNASYIRSELEMLYSDGKYSECIKRSQQEIDSGNEDHSILGFLAKCYANTGKYQEAISVLDKLISREISSDDIFYLYGTILTELKEIEKAKKMFKKGLYMNPNNLLSHLMLGNILKSEGNIKGAAVHYRNVIELTDKIKDADINIATGGMNKIRFREMINNFIKGE